MKNIELNSFNPHTRPHSKSFAGLTCINCQHQWIPRVPKPKFCAACHNPRWDNKQKVARQNHTAVRVKHSDIGIKG